MPNRNVLADICEIGLNTQFILYDLVRSQNHYWKVTGR